MVAVTAAVADVTAGKQHVSGVCMCRQGRYALFGHSMGAWIVWEMLQEITRRGLPLPLRLFVSGNRWAYGSGCGVVACGREQSLLKVGRHWLCGGQH